MESGMTHAASHTRHRALAPLFALVAAVGGTAGCGNEAPPMGDAVRHRDSMAVMVTRGVSKLISDSGVIRYKIVAEEWRIYDKTKPPRWEFPKGVFLERYDDKFKVNLHITADSAWLYDQNLWKLRGHVELNDQAAQTLMYTNELFWNMRTGELRSDVYTRLIEPDQEIEGNWFRAFVVNKRLTRYHIRQGKGFMPMADYENDSPTNEFSADTTGGERPVFREAPMAHPNTQQGHKPTN